VPWLDWFYARVALQDEKVLSQMRNNPYVKLHWLSGEDPLQSMDMFSLHFQKGDVPGVDEPPLGLGSTEVLPKKSLCLGFNKAFEAQFQFSPEEVHGRTFRFLQGPLTVRDNIGKLDFQADHLARSFPEGARVREGDIVQMRSYYPFPTLSALNYRGISPGSNSVPRNSENATWDGIDSKQIPDESNAKIHFVDKAYLEEEQVLFPHWDDRRQLVTSLYHIIPVFKIRDATPEEASAMKKEDEKSGSKLIEGAAGTPKILQGCLALVVLEVEDQMPFRAAAKRPSKNDPDFSD
jgi:hypothetical protein